jgi:hypothetical protein
MVIITGCGHPTMEVILHTVRHPSEDRVAGGNQQEVVLATLIVESAR